MNQEIRRGDRLRHRVPTPAAIALAATTMPLERSQAARRPSVRLAAQSPHGQAPGREARLPQTGQSTCHDVAGREIPCPDSGQDGEIRAGLPWPEPRFQPRGERVHDRLTGLDWTLDANPAAFPMTWGEALAYIVELNDRGALGFTDWRLPNRRELRSLVSHQTRDPALPAGHPFDNVFPGWYWTSTTAVISPLHAWYVHLGGARMFYGGKDQSFLVWPVRGTGNEVLPATGQIRCFDETGRVIACTGSGQDGESRLGSAWPVPRFEVHAETVLDRMSGLCWLRHADPTGAPVSWPEALAAVARTAVPSPAGPWRLPNIIELESLVDCGRHTPALPKDHPFTEIREGYWSSTTSLYEPDWAWALYLEKGAVGVGQKAGAYFHAWPVSGP
ncbi:hypothetical protein BMS3Bbin12_02259 [bacterium BMS3Bbin12]|nr:hypothetical protein BMS3Bbin12_02259 [bacterium BMS3Bbin12]GBE51325.1 hypothetical protein BMS3Bbin13_02283 [bacterium BMS3Bbin13]